MDKQRSKKDINRQKNESLKGTNRGSSRKSSDGSSYGGRWGAAEAGRGVKDATRPFSGQASSPGESIRFSRSGSGDTAEQTRKILEKAGLSPRKRFGQNFLIDEGVLDGIVAASGVGPLDVVLEIGPGIGTLTRRLAASAGKVLAVEIDRDLSEVLRETLAEFSNVRVINQDVLKVDLRALAEEHQAGTSREHPLKITANLPYYITTPILMGIFRQKLPVSRITVMVQKEVAERMQAQQGSKAYGALSLAVQYYSKAEIVLEVPPESFYPRPKVSSAVISLDVYEKPRVSVPDEKLLFDLISAAFSQRRKTLVNALGNASNIPVEKEEVEEALRKMDLPLQVRGEALSLEEYAKLTRLLHTEGQNDPDAMTE